MGIRNNPKATRFLGRALVVYGVFAMTLGGLRITRSITGDFNMKSKKKVVEFSESFHKKVEEKRWDDIAVYESQAAARMKKYEHQTRSGIAGLFWGAGLIAGGVAVKRRARKQREKLGM